MPFNSRESTSRCVSIAAAALAVAFTTLPAAAQVRLISTDSSANFPANSSLYEVSALTGAATGARATGIPVLADIEYVAPSGLIYAVNSTDLYTVSDATGSPTLVGSLGISPVEGDLAYNPASGQLQLISSLPSGFLAIYNLNTNTGQATLSASSTFTTGDFSGAAYTAAGQLYVLDTLNNLLLEVSSTAFVTNSFALSADLGTVAGFAIDTATGTAYTVDGGGNVVGTQSLNTLNLGNGQLTTVGPLGNAFMSGLTIGPQAFAPEPGVLALLLVTAPVVGSFARRPRRP